MGKNIGFCCCSGSNEGFWQWEEDASFRPCFRAKDKNSMAFQGRQVSFISLTPLNLGLLAMQAPLQLKAFAVLLKSEIVTGHWTWCGCSRWAWVNCCGADLRISLGYLQVELLSLPLQSWDFHNYLKVDMSPFFYMPVESNGVMVEAGIWPSLLHVYFCFAHVNYVAKKVFSSIVNRAGRSDLLVNHIQHFHSLSQPDLSIQLHN